MAYIIFGIPVCQAVWRHAGGGLRVQPFFRFVFQTPPAARRQLGPGRTASQFQQAPRDKLGDVIMIAEYHVDPPSLSQGIRVQIIFHRPCRMLVKSRLFTLEQNALQYPWRRCWSWHAGVGNA